MYKKWRQTRLDQVIRGQQAEGSRQRRRDDDKERTEMLPPSAARELVFFGAGGALMAHIVSYLSLLDTLSSGAIRVCKAWKLACDHSPYWKHFQINGLNALFHSKLADDYNFMGYPMFTYPNTTQTLRILARISQRVETIEFRNCVFADRCTLQLVLASAPPCLTKLTLHGCILTSPEFRYLLTMGLTSTFLERIDLSNCAIYKGKWSNVLYNWMKEMPHAAAKHMHKLILPDASKLSADRQSLEHTCTTCKVTFRLPLREFAFVEPDNSACSICYKPLCYACQNKTDHTEALNGTVARCADCTTKRFLCWSCGDISPIDEMSCCRYCLTAVCARSHIMTSEHSTVQAAMNHDGTVARYRWEVNKVQGAAHHLHSASLELAHSTREQTDRSQHFLVGYCPRCGYSYCHLHPHWLSKNNVECVPLSVLTDEKQTRLCTLMHTNPLNCPDGCSDSCPKHHCQDCHPIDFVTVESDLLHSFHKVSSKKKN